MRRDQPIRQRCWHRCASCHGCSHISCNCNNATTVDKKKKILKEKNSYNCMEKNHSMVDYISQRSCNKCNYQRTSISNKKTENVAAVTSPEENNASYPVVVLSINKWFQVQMIVGLWCWKFISSTITHWENHQLRKKKRW